MRHRRTGDKFALECEYHSRYYYSEKYHTQTIRWARPDQIENYLRYQKEQNVPVYVVIGVGNDILHGETPKELYCVPLNDIKNYPEVFASYLQKYRRPNPEKNFFWDVRNKRLCWPSCIHISFFTAAIFILQVLNRGKELCCICDIGVSDAKVPVIHEINHMMLYCISCR